MTDSTEVQHEQFYTNNLQMAYFKTPIALTICMAGLLIIISYLNMLYYRIKI